MIFKTTVFFVLIRQSICYLQQSGCSTLSFGKCPTRTYCGITDTGSYGCLPCPAGKLCPGDGYTYPVQQLNNRVLTHHTAKHIAKISNNTYIVSSDPSNRVLFRKKLKKIGKIVKVGLTVAAIAKTGGLAALKTAAAAKAKEFAIKKGIQCLKNGLSNFCNGKKKGAKLGAVKLKIKPKLGGGITKRVKNKPASIVSKKQIARPQITKKNSSKVRLSRTKTKPTRTKTTKTKPTRTKTTKTKPPNNPCSNIFDTLANKVNNVTRHVADNAVNKGRDWLKKNVGGNTGNCSPGSLAKQPTNLRGSKGKRGRSKSKSSRPGSSSNTDDSPNNSNTDDGSSAVIPTPSPKPRPLIKKQPVKMLPVLRTDDSTSGPTLRRRPIARTDDITAIISNPTSRPIKRRRPVARTDDSTAVTSNPTSRPVRKRPIAKTDDATYVTSNPTSRHVRRSRNIPNRTKIPTRTPTTLITRIPIARPTRQPTFISTVGPTRAPTSRRPSSIPTALPTRIPIPRPSARPSARPSPRPSAVPSVVPTPRPTARPSLRPSPRPSATPTFTPTAIAGPPTMIPGNGLSWSVFSSAPVSPTSFNPTRVPTFSMFTLTTSRPTQSPSSLRTVTTTVYSPTRTPTLTPNPTQNPTFLPSFNPTLSPIASPTFTPTIVITNAPTLAPTSTGGVGVSSINSASSSQSGVSNTAIGVGVGCLVIILALIFACVIYANNKKEKLSPYQIWSAHYSNKANVAKETDAVHTPHHSQTNMNEDIHHFYSKSPRLSINQNTTFTPHLSTKTAYRNSQLGGQLGSQRNSYRDSIPKGSIALQGRNGKNTFPL